MVFGRDVLWRRRVHVPVSLCVTVTSVVVVRFVQTVNCVVMAVVNVRLNRVRSCAGQEMS